MAALDNYDKEMSNKNVVPKYSDYNWKDSNIYVTSSDEIEMDHINKIDMDKYCQDFRIKKEAEKVELLENFEKEFQKESNELVNK